MKKGLIFVVMICLLGPVAASANQGHNAHLNFINKWLCFVNEEQGIRDLYYFMPNGRFLTSNETMNLDLFKILALKNDWQYDAQTQTIMTRLSLTTDSDSSSGPLVQLMEINGDRLQFVEGGVRKELSAETCELLK